MRRKIVIVALLIAGIIVGALIASNIITGSFLGVEPERQMKSVGEIEARLEWLENQESVYYRLTQHLLREGKGDTHEYYIYDLIRQIYQHASLEPHFALKHEGWDKFTPDRTSICPSSRKE